MAFRVNVRVDIDPSQVERNAERAQEILAVRAMHDTDQFVPAKTGLLTNMSRVENGKQIVYLGPYAQYLYHGKLMVDPGTGSSYAKKGSTKTLTGKDLVFSKAMHGKAQSEWFEASKSLNLDKWKRVFARAVTRGK